jgi:peptidyl-prolyl cis-trans isomerase A (cyclophilin A)
MQIMKVALLALLACVCVAAFGKEPKVVRVRIETEFGNIDMDLYPDKAPATVENFLKYVEAGMYDNAVFHRTVTLANQPSNKVKIEVIQGGRNPRSSLKDFSPIPLERTSKSGLRHLDGTVSMARNGPDTATCDFFICIGSQPELDFGGKRNLDGQGFAAFGKVTSGMDVVARIQRAPEKDQTLVPPIRILSVRILP